MRQDAITIRMDEFAKTIADIKELKKEAKWDQIIKLIAEDVHRLLGISPKELRQLTETGIMAKLIRNGSVATTWIPYKKIMVIALLKEIGDYAAVKSPPRGGRGWYLKALHLLLDSSAQDELCDCSNLVPNVEMLLTALSDSALPVRTRLNLMREYERRWQFDRVRDEFLAALETAPKSLVLINFGIAFFERLNAASDATLAACNLPRLECAAVFTDLVAKKVLLSSSTIHTGKPIILL